MATIPQPSLFTWQQIDTASDLDRLALVLDALPDEPLVRFLEERRGRGRDDYPVRPMWNAVIAGVVFQHPSCASLVRELWRNGELRQLCGFDPLGRTGAMPSADAMERFLKLIVEHREKLVEIFHRLVAELGEVLPDLGRRLAVDSKALRSAGRPVRDEGKQKERDGRRDLDADWGTKTYRGKRADGTAWEKTKRWFGYKLHLIVDSVYELPLAFEVTKASAGDPGHLLPLVEELEGRHEELHGRAEEVSGDKGYDALDNYCGLHDDHGIKPVIDTRQLWNDPAPRTLFGDRYDVFSYDESGRVYCTCPSERRGADEQRELAFVGFEKDRQTLKYRCPAAVFGFECEGRAECEKLSPVGVGGFGRVVRVPLSLDRRIFTPIARHTDKWKKAYDRRTAVERVNSRVDRVLGFEHHFIRGKDKMEMRVGLGLVVMLAMALGRIRANQAELMRSLTAPVRRSG
jgi:hypothetical protein